ncbi:MAG: hypothetical protein J6P55_05145 [Bacteroidaceae bacterium]|nr:hypothetical protein [Bacteroidaceae bacterium]MBR1902134.1 hypothetical protein [Bacteroidaceae bacterium]
MEQETDTLINNLRQHQPAACQKLLTEYGPAVFRTIPRHELAKDRKSASNLPVSAKMNIFAVEIE